MQAGAMYRQPESHCKWFSRKSSLQAKSSLVEMYQGLQVLGTAPVCGVSCHFNRVDTFSSSPMLASPAITSNHGLHTVCSPFDSCQSLSHQPLRCQPLRQGFLFFLLDRLFKIIRSTSSQVLSRACSPCHCRRYASAGSIIVSVYILELGAVKIWLFHDTSVNDARRGCAGITFKDQMRTGPTLIAGAGVGPAVDS